MADVGTGASTKRLQSHRAATELDVVDVRQSLVVIAETFGWTRLTKHGRRRATEDVGCQGVIDLPHRSVRIRAVNER